MASKSKVILSQKLLYFLVFLALTLIAAFVAVRIFNSAEKTGPTYLTAQYSALMSTNQYKGIITRSENLVLSTGEGIVEYYYPQGKHLSSGTLVCSLRNEYYGELLKEKAEEVHRQLMNTNEGLNSPTIQAINNRIGSQIYNWIVRNDPMTVYELKGSIDASLLERDSSFIISRNTEIHALLEEQGVYQSEMDQSSIQYFTPSSGMILYTYDSFEGWNCDQLTPDFLDRYNGQYQTIALDLDDISTLDPIYRLVMKDDWNITIFVSPEEAADYLVGSYYDLISEGMTLSAKAAKKVGLPDGRIKIVFEINEKLYEFSDKRVISVSRSEETVQGVQLPVSAVHQGAFYTVSEEFIFESTGQKGVMTTEEGKTMFVPIASFTPIADEEGNTVYAFSADELKQESVLLKKDSTETSTLDAPVKMDYVLVLKESGDRICVVEVLSANKQYAVITGVEPLSKVRVS